MQQKFSSLAAIDRGVYDPVLYTRILYTRKKRLTRYKKQQQHNFIVFRNSLSIF